MERRPASSLLLSPAAACRKIWLSRLLSRPMMDSPAGRVVASRAIHSAIRCRRAQIWPSCTTRTALTRSSGPALLARMPRAPATRAAMPESSPSSAATRTTAGPPSFLSAAQRPSAPSIPLSTSSTSGRAARSAGRNAASSSCPTAANEASAPMIRSRPSQKSRLSLRTATRTAFMA